MKHQIVRVMLIAGAAPVVIALTGAALQLSWLPQLPSRVAVHWSASGVDGTAAPWVPPLVTVVLGVVLVLLFGAFLMAGTRRGGLTPMLKLLGAISVAVVTALTIVFTASIAVQRGLRDPLDAPDILPAVLIGFAIGIGVGVVAWFALPRTTRGSVRVASATPMGLVAGERAVWVDRARLSSGAAAGLGVVVILVAGIVTFSVAASGGRAWPVVLIPIVLGLLLFGLTSWQVRVDAQGLTVRGALGWPVFRVRPDEVASVGAASVNPFGEFGGWGIRVNAHGALGIVTRAGEGLVVHRTSGRDFVVTVDDAGTAASLLSAFATEPTP